MGQEYSKLQTQSKTKRKIEKPSRKISRTVRLHLSILVVMVVVVVEEDDNDDDVVVVLHDYRGVIVHA